MVSLRQSFRRTHPSTHNSRRSAPVIANRIREGARATAERIRRDTELTAAAIVDAAQRRVRERLAATAARLARELIEKSFEAADQARLIDSFIDKIRHEAAQ